MDSSNPRFEIKRNGLIGVSFPRSLCRCSLERTRTLAHLFRIEFSNTGIALASDDVRKAATEFLLSECETAGSIRLRLWEKQDVFATVSQNRAEIQIASKRTSAFVPRHEISPAMMVFEH